MGVKLDLSNWETYGKVVREK